MTNTPRWLPGDIPVAKPSAARMYDYFLGGYHNFAVDRAAAEQMRAVLPNTPLFMQAHRGFLRRAITFLHEQGIDQYLDLASTVPTVGSAHEVVQRLNPAGRVVYADIDPDGVRHAEVILRGVPNTAVVQLDAYHPEQLLNHPDVRHLLDFDRPIGLLLGWLFFVPDDQAAYNLVRLLRDAVVPCSYVAIAHATAEGIEPEVAERGEEVYASTTAPVKTRPRAQIEAFFSGFDLVEPGIVFLPSWRPEGPDDILLDRPDLAAMLCGVGRKR